MTRRPSTLRSLAPAALPALAALLAAGCLFAPERSAATLPETFTVGSVAFPDSAVYARAARVPEGGDARTARFLEKCRAGGTVRLGFIGGSITGGATAGSRSGRFSTLLTAWLRRQHPGLQVEEVNAGVPATGSRYAVSRAKHDLFAAPLDLVVVEFAVNDFGEDPAQARATIEGLVRQILARDTSTAIVMLYMSKDGGWNLQGDHEMVATHYGLPSVSWRDAVWPLVDSGRVDWKDVFHDDPHPNANGHRIAAHLLAEFLTRAGTATGSIPSVPAAWESDLYERAGMMEPGDSTIAAEAQGWSSFLDERRTGWSTPGADTATLVLRTSAREVALGIRVRAGDTSVVHVRVDDGPEIALSNAARFPYTRFVRLFAGAEAKPRTVRIRHAGGGPFTLDRILYAGPPGS